MEIRTTSTKAGIRSITITLDPETDDPDGHIAGLILRGRLDAFLRAYARPGDLGAPADPGDAYALLTAFGFVTAMCTNRLEAMQVAARDQWLMGWGTIAAALESSRSTVKSRIQATRRRFVDSGVWYDPAGIHAEDPDTARQAVKRAFVADDEERTGTDD